MGRTLRSGHKLSATLPEIIRAARAETDRINDDEGPPKGQRKQPAHIINAALCWFFAQPPEDRDRILRAGYQTLIAHMALDRPAPIPVGRSLPAIDGAGHPRHVSSRVTDRPQAVGEQESVGTNVPAVADDRPPRLARKR